MAIILLIVMCSIVRIYRTVIIMETAIKISRLFINVNCLHINCAVSLYSTVIILQSQSDN